MPASRAAIVGYSIIKPSRARKDRGEEVLSTEQYQALALTSILGSLGLAKRELNSMRFLLGLNHPLWPHALIYSSEVASNLGLSPSLSIVSDHGGMSALHLLVEASLAVSLGEVEIAVLIGADSPLTPATPMGKWRLDRTWRYELNYEIPLGMIGPISEGGLLATRYMSLTDLKQEHLGTFAVALRRNAQQNPFAYLREPLSLDEYMKSPYIAYPLRLLDAVIPVNGAFALAVTSEELAKRYTPNPVYVRGHAIRVNAEPENELREVTDLKMRDVAEEALRRAGLRMREIDLFQLYDDFTVVPLLQMDSLGLLGESSIGKFVENTDFTYAGNLPVNTGGGQLSGGQAGTAGGFGLIVEAVKQLRGEAEGRQVKGARNALITGLGGLGYNNNLLNKGVLVISNEK